jgi:hypothetical protein
MFESVSQFVTANPELAASLFANLVLVMDKIVAKTSNKYDDMIWTGIKGAWGALTGKKK